MKLAEDLRRSVLQAAIEGKLTGGSQEGWRWVKLGEISTYGEHVTKINAKNIPANSWLLDLEDIERGGQILRIRTAQEIKSTGDKAAFHEGDILYSKLRPYLLKVLIAPSDGFCTPELIPFQCHKEIDPQYIVYFLQAPSVNHEINSASYGVKMPRVGTNTMINLCVPLPPLNEQRLIVSRLDEILPKIAELESLENELEALKKKFPGNMRDALLQAAIEGKLTGGSQEGWRWVTIGDVFSLKAGKCTSAASIYPEKSEENCYPCFGGNGIRGYKSEFNAEGIHPIIGRQGALCGCLNMAEGKFYATEHAVVVTMLADTNPYFAYYALKAMNLNQYATATAQPGLSVRKILTTPFPLPPLDEQNKIVSRLNELLPLCDALEEMINI